MIQVTLHFETQDDLVAFFTRGATPVAAVAETAKVIEKAAAKKPVKAEEPAPTPTATATAAPTQTATAPAEPVGESPSDAVTYDDCAALVIKYSKLHGRPATVEVLKPFGITSLPGAKPEQYAAIAAAFALELGNI